MTDFTTSPKHIPNDDLTPSNVICILSKLLELAPETLHKALRQSRSSQGYERYVFPKGNGKDRVINAPALELKQVQRSILDQLLSQISVTPFSHGFVPHRSIITNALVHASSAHHVLNLDLQDAFPSVSEERVLTVITWHVGRLLKLNAPQLSAEERDIACQAITRLVTRDGALPQGAPTSGYILNLVCARLDRLVYAAALRSRLPQVKYSRYADDLTITSSAPIPPEFIAQIKRAVIRSGFKVNPHKIHSHSDSQRAIVICGVRLHNHTLALPKSSIKRYRAILDEAAKMPAESLEQNERARILGVLSYLRSIYPSPPRALIKPLQRLIRSHSSWLEAPRQKTISRFTHYSYQGGAQDDV